MRAGPRVAAFLLLALFLAQGLFLIEATSPTADEIPFHMVNGYVYLNTRDYRMSPANPALLREWMALPWFFFRPKLDLEKESWREAESEPFAHEFFYQDNRTIANRLLYSSRFMILLLGLGLGVLIWAWARQLYGEGGGLLSLSLYTFCPNFLAHSSIAHTDVGVSFFSVLAAFFLWRYLEKEDPKTLWAFSLTLGLAFAAKYNALILGPVFLTVFLVKKGFAETLRVAAVLIPVAFFVIWASYGFEFRPMLAGGVPRVEEKLSYLPWEFLKRAALEMPVPIPSYLLGIMGNVRSHSAPYWHYAFGEWTTQTHPYYYLFCFAVKMTLVFLAAAGLRFFFKRHCDSPSRNENWAILVPTAVMFLATVFDSTAVGVRYLFPVIPLLFVWVGGLARLAEKSRMWAVALIAGVILNAALVLPVFPHYLSYFNEFVGGVEGGYRYVRGSDVDWGQGLKALGDYVRKKRIDSIVLRHFGPSDPSFYGIPATPLTEEEAKSPAKKIYAIGLFYLEHAEWAPRTKPTDIIGGSIFIYDFR